MAIRIGKGKLLYILGYKSPSPRIKFVVKNMIFDLQQGEKVWVHGESRYQYMPTRFVAEVVKTLHDKEQEGDIINVCGEGTISTQEVADILGRNIQYNVSNPPVDHYEINIDKLKTLMSVPESHGTIRSYLQNNEDLPSS